MRGYFIRITPDDANMTLYDMKDFLDLTLECQQYVVSREEASRVHFHVLLYVPLSAERLRYRIKSCIEGQVYISGKDIQDKVRCIAYTMKDGLYKFKGIDVAEYLRAKQISHKKKKFDDCLRIIEQNYSRSHADEALIDELIQLHCDFKRRIYRHHLKALFESVKIEFDEGYRERVKKEILGYW